MVSMYGNIEYSKDALAQSIAGLKIGEFSYFGIEH